MITPKMKKWLEKTQSDPSLQKTIIYHVYMNRIQKRIARELDGMLWLARNYPSLLLDEEREMANDSGKTISHRRLKMILLTLKAVNPKVEVELVLRELDFPDEEEEQKITSAPSGYIVRNT